MRRAFRMFKNAHFQTKIFILTLAIYMLAIAWTTIQAYARLEFNRTGTPTESILIPSKPSDQK